MLLFFMILKDVHFDIFVYLVMIALESGGLVFFGIERPLLFILIGITCFFRLTYFFPRVHVWRIINWIVESVGTIILCEWIMPIPPFQTIYIILLKFLILTCKLLILELRFAKSKAIMFGSNYFKTYLEYMGYEETNKECLELYSDSPKAIWENIKDEKKIISFPSFGHDLFYYFTKEHEISMSINVFPLFTELNILLITDDWNVVKSFHEFYKNLTVVTNNISILEHNFCKTILYSTDVISDLNNYVDIIIDAFFLNIFNYHKYIPIYDELSELNFEKKILIVLNKTGFVLENFLLNMFKELLFISNERCFSQNIIVFRFNELSNNDFTKEVDMKNLICEENMHHLIDVDTIFTSIISNCMNLFIKHPEKSRYIVSLVEKKVIPISQYIYTYNVSKSTFIKYVSIPFYNRFHEEKILDGNLYLHSYKNESLNLKVELLNNKDLQYLMQELVYIFMR